MADIKYQFNDSTFINPTFNYGDKKITKVLGALPAKPNLFIGRGNSTAEIHQKLNNQQHNNLLLLVNGNGGIGKTTMAAQYYFEYFEHYAHLIWLVSEKGIKEALVSLALSLRLTFNDQLNQAQQIEEIIRNVSELEKPMLLIIDNANNLTDLEDNFRLLRQFQNTHILITSKVNDYPNIEYYKVNHLDKQSANELFKYHFKAFKATEQSLLDELLEAIGYNTLVIELLSKNLNEFNNDIKSHYPLQKLLEDIQVKGILAISKSTPVNTDYKLEPATPEAIITTMYDVSPLTENEKHILSIFAVLPATAIPFTYLEQFLPSIEALDRVLIALSNKGWIEYDKTFQSFKTNPIISEIARTQNKDRLEKDTETLLYCLINLLKYEPVTGNIEGDFKMIEKIVSYAEAFANNFKIFNYRKSVLLERLGNFYYTYGNLDKALKLYMDGFAIIKVLFDNDPDNADYLNAFAITCEKLGEIYTTRGNLENALRFFEISFKITKVICENNSKDEYFKKSFAITLEKLGETHSAMENMDKALKFFKDSTALLEELYKSNQNKTDFKSSLAIAYGKLGETHLTLDNLDKARKFFKKVLKLTKKLYKSDSNNLGFKRGLAITYEGLGQIYMKLRAMTKSLKFFEYALKLKLELYESHPNNVGFKNGLAIAYFNLGVLYVDDLNDTDKGIDLLNKAKAIYAALVENHPQYADFKQNYDWVLDKIESMA